MSLRRSARVKTGTSLGAIATAGITKEAPKKKSRHVKTAASKSTTEIASKETSTSPTTKATTNGSFAAPTTPAKRRKIETKSPKPPPITPTPSAIGLMLSKTPNAYSTGDIDDPAPTTRPAEPHHTNAPLHADNNTQVLPSYSNFESGSPSKPPTKATATTSSTATILADGIAHLLNVDPSLQKVIDAHHCRVFDPEGLAEEIDPFRSLASGIMAQQVSGAAASSIKNKFIELFPAQEGHSGPPHFPPAKLVAETKLERLRQAGLSGRKAEYIKGLAEKFASGELSAELLAGGSDEEVMERLVAVRGLGRWSVEMFCCFGLKRMDVFSTGDLGVQRGMAAYVGRDVSKLKAKGGGKWKYMSEKDMVETAAKFAPYRSLFMWYMWRIEDVLGQGKGTNVDAVQNA